MSPKAKKITNIIEIALLAIIAIVLVAWLIVRPHKAEEKNIAVFVPGVIANSPVYEMLSEGVLQAAIDYNQKHGSNVKVEVVEAGTNQTEWGPKLTSLAAMGKYELIISSNPSIPDLALPLTEKYPEQKFIILDSFCEGNANIATSRFNQREQGYLAGYAAALASIPAKSGMEKANPQKKIALVAAQEYPVMNQIIYPAFVEGAKAVDKNMEVEFRLVGNWYDATKASEIARSLYNSGVDVILPICGGAAQGILSSAQELGFYVSWFDDNGFKKAPGYVISSSTMEQKTMAYESITDYLNGKTEFGKAKTVGIKDGYVKLVTDDDLFKKSTTEEFRLALISQYERIKKGSIDLSN